MAEIMTVMGPIIPEKLGFTDMHTHILWDGKSSLKKFGNWEIPEDKADIPVKMEDIGLLRRNPVLSSDNIQMKDTETMVDEVLLYKKNGGSSLLEMDPPGLRYNVQGLRSISEKTGVHIIASTGFYLEGSWPHRFRNMSIEEYISYMKKEIEEGIEDTDIKAGHIKIAINNLSLQQEKALRAAARVALMTGLALTIHPGFGIGSDGRRIIQILLEEKMNLKKTTIAHAQHFFVESDLKKLILDPASWKLHLDNARELLLAGANIAIDTFGHMWSIEMIGFERPTEWQRLAGLVALIKEGYSNQIVLGTDTFFKILLVKYGGEGFSRLLSSVIPILKELQVSDYDIHKLTVENPARILAY